MKQVLISLPDSVELSEQEIQALVLEKVTGNKRFAPASVSELTMLVGRLVPATKVADIRHLIDL